MKHFEDLWLKCEEFNKENSLDKTEDLLSDILMKFNLYKTIHLKECPEEEKTKIKNRLMGEILLSLTNLSLLDNINVYKALEDVYEYKALTFYSEKHK